MSEYTAIRYTPIILKGFSAFIIYLGGKNMVQGIDQYLPPDEQAKLSSDAVTVMDSQYRYFGGTFIAYGAAIAWTAYDIAERQLLLNILLGGLMLTGIGRAISGSIFGLTIPWLRRATVTELIVPPVVYWFGVRKYA
ncbi:hypothetical protein ACLX1H_005035 [Fusarium chlamydosporum]